MFAAVRHPDIEALGIIPDGTLDAHRVRGWYRVSLWVEAPSDLNLPDYAESHVDLDAEPEPPKKPSKPAAAPVDEDEENKA